MRQLQINSGSPVGCQNPIPSLSWSFAKLDSSWPPPCGVGEASGALASVLYVLDRRVLTLPTLKFRSEASKDLEDRGAPALMSGFSDYFDKTCARGPKCIPLLRERCVGV